jgi:hypothetical protein
MRTLIAAMLILAAPLSLAAPSHAYQAGWNPRTAPAAATRQLVGEARYLDQAANSLFDEISSRNGRSELTLRARGLAEAAADFRRKAERGASWSQLSDSLQRVSARQAYLERRLDSRERKVRLRYAFAGLQQVDLAVRRASGSLQRFARDNRGDRGPDRYAFNPRDPDRDRQRARDDGPRRRP